MNFTGGHLIWITTWVSIATALYVEFAMDLFVIPVLPLSLVGTAVAFYIGFKNNQAYDRLWEARKIWGAIVNSSRAWASAVRGFVGQQAALTGFAPESAHDIHRRLIFRHIAWLYSLRSQLLIPTAWEHINQNRMVARVARDRIKKFGVGLLDDDITEKALKEFLPAAEHDRLINYKNTATQIIDQQAQDLAELRRQNLIDDFRHMELQKILYDFYVHQGKCERIKKFPLPRQYGGMSFIFVAIFIFLVPFGIAAQFGEATAWSPYLSIPFSIIVSWVYLVMELVGDYSENPFEGMGNDIPMYSLCRVIEIDLKEMLTEQEIPGPVEAVRGVLM
ncbi:MAG: bestrophin family ion channel [Bacteroidota bacterium]